MKRILDAVVAATLLVVLAPLIAVVAVMVRINLGGPVLFRQQRNGLGGQPFHLVKFRSMRAPVPGREGPQFDDERLTPFGRFLRATSLDELPELVNVVRGDMSLVGPRPLPVAYLPRYNTHQARRHEARPGITGWAQINGRNTVGWEERLDMDVWYVDNRSLRLDLRILCLTVSKVLKREGVDQAGGVTMTEFLGSSTRQPVAV